MRSLGTILAMIDGLLSVAGKIVYYMERKQLMDAGRAKEQRDNLKEAKDALDKANRARKSARNDIRNGRMRDKTHFRD